MVLLISVDCYRFQYILSRGRFTITFLLYCFIVFGPVLWHWPMWTQHRNIVDPASEYGGPSAGILWHQQRNTVAPAKEYCGPTMGILWTQNRNTVAPAKEYCGPVPPAKEYCGPSTGIL